MYSLAIYTADLALQCCTNLTQSTGALTLSSFSSSSGSTAVEINGIDAAIDKAIEAGVRDTFMEKSKRSARKPLKRAEIIVEGSQAGKETPYSGSHGSTPVKLSFPDLPPGWSAVLLKHRPHDNVVFDIELSI